MKQIILFLTFLLYYNAALFAQEDSITIALSGKLMDPVTPKTETFFHNRWVQSTYIGVPLFAAGLIEMHDNHHFRSLRNDFVKWNKKHEFENYLQYSPGAVMLAMKALGVKSRSSWGKMMTAGASTVMIQFVTTHAIKRVAKEERPDSKGRNSFPSGHTATAFMTATMLDKEYGHISPWISIGGYTIATTTGVMRMVNNRHWMSDVLAGAGIGIVSAEFGYWLADIIFPRSPKSFNVASTYLSDPERHPSFIGINAGIYMPLQEYGISGSNSPTVGTGGTVGIEGAYFFDKHWGIGAQASVCDMDLSTESTLRFATTQAGGYYSQKLYDRLFLRAKMLGGTVIYPEQQETLGDDLNKVGLCGTAGVSLGLRAKDHFDVSAGIDYTALSSWSKSNSAMKSALVFEGKAAIRF